MAIKKFEHVGIQVKDLVTSIDFYTNVVGLELLKKEGHVDPAITLAFLGIEGEGEPLVEIIEGYNPNLPAEGKVHHLAFTVEDIEAEIERVKEHGVTFVEEAVTTLPNGAKYIFFYGPDGEWIEFFQPHI
ncbi:VOC family protein [Heyndrickxia acidicola]|uniref:VOC family protein n=1 Tax=Heyndrickxia acidicola TaxID=209389 RepID=A0ABU6MGD0_9BACI|nr:VOC family protein [Heyndrickxia acidicola]MED1203339.1 VOC family protein [Heyndrickxia acidicola]